MTKTRLFSEKVFFALLVLIGLLPVLLNKYYLTLDGPGHIYNGNIIKELILNSSSEFGNLFKINSLPVPNWISHFLFAIFNLVLPDYISEKLVLGIYLVLFPLFFRKTVLWFKPENKLLSYFGILFAHNHLLYLGSYNLVYAIAFSFVTFYFILRTEEFSIKSVLILMSLFLLVYFSHMLILLITFAVAILLPLAGFHVEKEKNKLLITNQEGFFNRLKVVGISLIPAGALTALYLIKVDSLEEAGRMDLGILLGWLVDIRPMLTLCMCKPWIDFTHILLGLFVFMILVNLYILVKENIHAKDGKLHVSIPAPRFNIIWFLLFFGFTLVYLIVPNANILPERLIILVFVFLGFWLATQKYPKWVQYIFVSILVTTHVTFAFLHTKHMRPTSDQISKMSEVSEHIEEGSLLLPFNYAYHHNWLHMHSPGYFGSDKPVAVIENYEGALQWFPVKWNYEGPYVLDKISVWAADNRKLIDSMYLNADNPDVFSMPKKDGSSAPIPYVVIFGKVAEEHQESYLKIMSVLDLSYELSFDNGFCKLYKQITAD